MYHTFMKHKTIPQFTATASSAEVARNFGRYKDLAQRGAVAVTSHGRESVVMLSADEYARLKALDDREALYIYELPDDMVEALEKAKPSEAAKAFDFELSQSITAVEIPDREPGLVIRYAYLWRSEHMRGLEEGRKDRPCAIVLAVAKKRGRNSRGGRGNYTFPTAGRYNRHIRSAAYFEAAWLGR